MPLESFNIAEIKESVKASALAAAAPDAAPAAFNHLLCSQAPISSVAALRAIKPLLKPITGYMNKGFGFEDYSTVTEWARKEAANGPLGYQCVALVMKVECGLQMIVLADATVEALKGEAPWTAVLLEKLGMKVIASLIVRKGANPNPKGKKADLVLQVGVLWATKL